MKISSNFLLVVCTLLLIISFSSCSTSSPSRESGDEAFENIKWDDSVPTDDFDTSSYLEEGKESLETEELDT